MPGVTLRYVDRAYLWAPALGTGHTYGSRRLGPGIPVGPGAWDRAYLWVPALGTGHTCGSRRLGLGIPVGPGAWAHLHIPASCFLLPMHARGPRTLVTRA
jgi:hypothetical protein